MAGFDPDAYLAQKPSAPAAFDPDAYLGNEIPGPRREPAGALTRFGRAAASLADVTVGGVLPAIAQQVTYPVARAFGQSPQEASKTAEQVTGAVDKPFGKAFGVTATPEYTGEASRRIMDFVGANIQKGSKWISEKTGLPEADVANMIGTLSLAAPEAVRASTPVVKAGTEAAVQGVKSLPPVKAKLAEIEAKNVATSYANATKIEAAQAANKLGVALNPAESNPTLGNRMRSVLTGNKDVNTSLAKANEGKWVDVVKQDLGVPPEGRLNAGAIEQALDAASKPYDAVRAIPQMEPSGEVLASIRGVSKPATIGGKAKADAVNTLVNETTTALKEGRSGAQIIDDIRQLRRDAQSTYKARDSGNNPPPADVALADAKIEIANSLERMIDEHAPNPQVLSDFQQARTRMAQIYDHERAIDFATNKVDPQVYAKLLDERKGNMTGVGADIGKVAANFPEVSKANVKATPVWQQDFTRSGVAGTLGYAAGHVVGSPVVGAITGAVAGKVASGIAAKRMATPAYQAAHAVPIDYRPVNTLRPADLTYGVNQLVPYDFGQTIVTRDQIPNWVYGRGETPVNVGIPSGPAALGAPSAEATINALRAEDVRRAGVSRAIGQEAEARAAAAEAAARRPTSGEVILDLDPITGRLRESSQGLKGATPETFSNFGAALETASNKLSAGKPFDLTASEKIAWDKTKVDLAEVAPGFKALSDKAIAEKMMDREWVQGTLVKAREKAAAFEQIAARAKDERMRQMALTNRERMMDLAEQMESSLGTPRPVAGKSQGPKTREFQRNMLRGGSSENALTR